MKKSKNKNLQQIKIENFLMVSTGTAAGAVLAFMISWTVPVTSVFAAKKSHQKSGKFGALEFLNAYEACYRDSIYDLSQIPFTAYNCCKERANQRIQEYQSKQK